MMKITVIQKHFLILISLWLVFQLFLLYHFGIVTAFESRKYIEQAENLLTTGSYSSNNFIFYSTQILLIAASKKMQTGYGLVIVMQLLVNAASVYCFYKIINRFTGKAKVAFLFTLAFISMFYYQLYNVYLFTESLYFSFSIIFFYVLLHVSKLHLRSIATIGFGLILLYFTRPVGIFFLPATFIFLVLKFYSKRAVLLFCFAGMVFLICFFLLLNNTLNAGGELDFLLPYTNQMIICGVPAINNPNKIPMKVEGNSVQGLFYLITHNSGLVLSLATKRLVAFFGVVRSYYSQPHNLFIALYFYGFYVLIIIGIKKWIKQKTPEISFMLCLIFFTALTTALSCDEWHNRFIFAILPFMMMLGSLAFVTPAQKENI